MGAATLRSGKKSTKTQERRSTVTPLGQSKVQVTGKLKLRGWSNAAQLRRDDQGETYHLELRISSNPDGNSSIDIWI